MKFSLGKFSSKRCDLLTMFDNVAVLLRAVTINIDKNYTKRIPLINYFIVIVTSASYFYIYIFSTYWFVFIRCRETGDYRAATIVFSAAAISETTITKLLFMKINKNTVQGIVQRFLICDSKVEPESRFSKNLLKHLCGIKKRIINVWFSFVAMYLTYTLRAILSPDRQFSPKFIIIYGLEPMDATPHYEIALTFMTITISAGIYTLAGVTVFILVIIGYIEAQMLTLSEEMLSLWEDGEKYYEDVVKTNRIIAMNDQNIIKDKIINKHVNNRLKKIITFHIENINLLNDFDTVFRVTMAIEFILIIVAIVSALLGGIEYTYLEMAYTFVQVFMDCFTGQHLIDASNIFENSIYNCKWENFDNENMKIVLVMLQCAQKSLTLTAGGLAKLDYMCLMSVIKSAYSTYTTLRSTVN